MGTALNYSQKKFGCLFQSIRSLGCIRRAVLWIAIIAVVGIPSDLLAQTKHTKEVVSRKDLGAKTSVDGSMAAESDLGASGNSFVDDGGASLAAGFKRAARLAKERLIARSATTDTLTASNSLRDAEGVAGMESPSATTQPVLLTSGLSWEGCSLNLKSNPTTGHSLQIFTVTPNEPGTSSPTFLTSVSNSLPGSSPPYSYMAVGHYEGSNGLFRAFRVTQQGNLTLGDFQNLQLNTNSCSYSESFAYGVSEAAETIVGAACVNTSGQGCAADKDLRPVRWGCGNFEMRTVAPPSSWGQPDWQRSIVHGESVGNSGEATAVDGDGDVVVGWTQRSFPAPAGPGQAAPPNNKERNPFRWRRDSSCGNVGVTSNLPLVKNGLVDCGLGSSDQFFCVSYNENPPVEQAGAFGVSRDGKLVVGYQKTLDLGSANQCERSFSGGAFREVASQGFFWNERCGGQHPRGLLPRGRSWQGWCPQGVRNHPRGVARGLSPDGLVIVGEDHSDRINASDQGSNNVISQNRLAYVPNRHRWLPRHFTADLGGSIVLQPQFDLGAWSQEGSRWEYRSGPSPSWEAVPVQWGPIQSSQIPRDSRLRDGANGGNRASGQTFVQGDVAAGTPALQPRAVVSGLPAKDVLTDLKAHLISKGVNPDSGNQNGAVWQLVDARSISPDGKVVVGEAVCNLPDFGWGEKTYGFIARIP